jgi:hypothetical protein
MKNLTDEEIKDVIGVGPLYKN